MRAVVCFGGMGGADLGLSEVGFDVEASIEYEQVAVATMQAAGLRGVQADARSYDFRQHRGVGLFWASPPCQAGSTAGKRRGAHDDRNGWPWTMRAIDEMKPQYFLAENVLGWTYHKKGCPRTLADLSCVGCYWENWILPQMKRRFPFVGFWILNSADYGTPQFRRRVILWAGQLPLSTTPPEPSHQSTLVGEIPPGMKPWVSIQDAIGDTLNRKSCAWRRCYPVDGSHGRSGAEPWRLDQPSPTVMTTEEKGTRANAKSGWSFNGGPDRASDTAFLVAGIRRITVQEGLTLQGFPKAHPVQGTKKQQYRQVGNALPPSLARVTGALVADALRATVTMQPRQVVAVGESLRQAGNTLPLPFG